MDESLSRWRRRFGRPRCIDDWERVWLIPVAQTIGEWRLNDQALEWTHRDDGVLRSNVSDLLKERNEIVAELPGDLVGAVLEIGCRAFIQGVSIASETIAIDISSESVDDSLELYVLIDGETHAYFGPFSTNGLLTHEFRLDELDGRTGATVRVDLICRSEIWDSVERET